MVVTGAEWQKWGCVQMVIVKYSKTGQGMFFAHSDMIRIWQRIFAISGVDISQKSASSGEKRIYFSNPTRVNVESSAEYVGIDTPESGASVRLKIQNNLPEFMQVISVFETDKKISLSAMNNCAKYAITFDEYKTCKGKIKDFFTQNKIEINIELHSEKRQVDVKDRIYKIEYKDDGFEIFAGVNDNSVRIDELAKAMMRFCGKRWETCSVIKQGLFVFENEEFKDVDCPLK